MKKIRRYLAKVLPTLTVLGFVGILLCFVNRWDQVTPLTIIPIWIWACAGCLGCTLAWLISRSPLCLAVFLAWLVVGVAYSDESLSLYHDLRTTFVKMGPEKAPAAPARTVRVTVLEAAGASHDAVWDIARFSPDIVLLQGVPTSELARLTVDFFEGDGGYVAAGDCAVLARGKVRAAPVPPDFKGARALVEWPGGILIDAVSLRLSESYPRWDFLRPSVWQGLVDTRRSNRSSLRTIMRLYEEVVTDDETKPFRLLGGNFATPPGDDIFRHLRSHGLEDAHALSSTGWGSTYPGDHPILRPDQLWSEPEFVPLSLSAVKIEGATHRLLMGDFLMGRSPAAPSR